MGDVPDPKPMNQRGAYLSPNFPPDWTDFMHSTNRVIHRKPGVIHSFGGAARQYSQSQRCWARRTSSFPGTRSRQLSSSAIQPHEIQAVIGTKALRDLKYSQDLRGTDLGV